MKRLRERWRLLVLSLSLAVGFVAWLFLYPGTVDYRPVEAPAAFRWSALADALRATRGLHLAVPERGETTPQLSSWPRGRRVYRPMCTPQRCASMTAESPFVASGICPEPPIAAKSGWPARANG
ncbi:MAG: hypothetical protein HY783_06105 [Chloroflexi bacterium]|nr:hypothetical protein [Chloroflexota bacterium]